MKYNTNCTIRENGPFIDEMVETGIEINYKELLENVSQEELDRIFPMYIDMEGTLSLESDYAITYYKGKFKNKKCVWAEHSSIEYIFTN